MGLFGSILDILQAGMDIAQDAESIEEAESEMYSMCGNEGQTAILDEGMDGFRSWAEATLSFNGSGGPLEGYLGIGDEKYFATGEIWEAGQEIVGDEVDSMLDGGDGELADDGDEGDDDGLW